MNFQTLSLILAQEAGGAPQKPGGLLGSPMVMVGLMMVMMYFVLIRPQRKQQKALEAMRNQLGIGDKVITAGGMHGIVTGQSKSTVSVKVSDGLSIKFERASIQTVVSSKGKGVVVDELPDDIEDVEGSVK